jgi:predicted exporter
MIFPLVVTVRVVMLIVEQKEVQQYVVRYRYLLLSNAEARLKNTDTACNFDMKMHAVTPLSTGPSFVRRRDPESRSLARD